MLTFYFYEMTKIAFTWFKRGYQISSHLPSDHYLLRPSLSLPTHADPQISSSASGPKFLLLHPEGSPCASLSHFLLRVQTIPLISSEAKVLFSSPKWSFQVAFPAQTVCLLPFENAGLLGASTPTAPDTVATYPGSE